MDLFLLCFTIFTIDDKLEAHYRIKVPRGTSVSFTASKTKIKGTDIGKVEAVINVWDGQQNRVIDYNPIFSQHSHPYYTHPSRTEDDEMIVKFLWKIYGAHHFSTKHKLCRGYDNHKLKPFGYTKDGPDFTFFCNTPSLPPPLFFGDAPGVASTQLQLKFRGHRAYHLTTEH